MSEKILPLRGEEVKSLLEKAAESGPRDELMVRLLLGTGMRVGELCPLTPGDLDVNRGAITLSKCITNPHELGMKATHGSKKRPAYNAKRELTILVQNAAGTELTGEKVRAIPSELVKRFPHGELVKLGLKASQPTRVVPLTDRVALSMLREWSDGIPSNRFLWLSQQETRMRYKTVFELVKGLMLGAFIPEAKCHPHQLRHTFAVAYLRKTRDLAKLQRTLGHTDIGTTTIYLRFAYDDLKEAMEKAGDLYSD